MLKTYHAQAISLWERYERYTMPIAFAAGFVWDNITLTRIDLLLDNAILLFYIVIALSAIFLMHAHEAGRLRSPFIEQYLPGAPFLMQFAFGGLFSGFVVFYTRSASPGSSWPFLLFLTFIFVGNELFKKRYAQVIFHTCILFIALFSYTIFSLPILTGSMGVHMFLLSGAVSLAAIALVARGIALISPALFKEKSRKQRLITAVCSIYLLFTVMYFTNVIPPIPLSLKESGVYHEFSRISSGSYRGAYEPALWYEPLKETSSLFHQTGESVTYHYSAVFAPTKLNLTIFHRWSHWNPRERKWVETDHLGFSISGGRDGGYRGFTMKKNITPGKWRVDVMTNRGQILGRTSFTVIDSISPTLVTKTL